MTLLLKSRREYLLKQQKIHNRKLLGVFPAQYPREILWAFNILPVEIWDPPLEIKHANAHLQSYICSVVQSGLELILQGKTDILDGFLFPHTCDSIQNLASIVSNYLKIKIPCYFFYHPKAPYGDSARQYYHKQLLNLIKKLENQFGQLYYSTLRKSIDQGRHVTSLIQRLYDLRSKGKLQASNAKFYHTIRQGEFLYPDDYINQLEDLLEGSKGLSNTHPGVILSGVLPNPPQLLSYLDHLGIQIVNDDFLNCSRRLLTVPNSVEDPLEALVESYFSLPPCSTRDSSLTERKAYLFKLIDESNAQGIIFNIVKFCEPESFDLPQLLVALKEKGLATIAIDTEINQDITGQIKTRLEAFVEMIS